MGEAAVEGAVPSCLDRLLAQGEEKLLHPPAGEARSVWAHDLCAWSRETHVELWDSEPDRVLVKRKIIPLFVRVEAAIRSVPPSDEHPTDCYADNVVARIENLNRYARGERSDFDPAEKDPAEAIVGDR